MSRMVKNPRVGGIVLVRGPTKNMGPHVDRFKGVFINSKKFCGPLGKMDPAIVFKISKNLRVDYLVDVRNPKKKWGPQVKQGKGLFGPFRKIRGPLGKTEPSIVSRRSKNLCLHMGFSYFWI